MAFVTDSTRLQPPPTYLIAPGAASAALSRLMHPCPEDDAPLRTTVGGAEIVHCGRFTACSWSLSVPWVRRGGTAGTAMSVTTSQTMAWMWNRAPAVLQNA